MTVAEIRQLVDDYAEWLRQNTGLREVGVWVEITTPHLDRHNDQIQIYVRRADGELILTDDAYTISDLRQSGCDLRTPRRQRLLETTLNGFGVKLDDDALVAHATPRTFPLKKHSLVQAILAVNDLFYLAQANVKSVFQEDVAEWLSLADVRAVRGIKITGASGFDHVFDFVIPASRQAPERIVKAVNRPSRDAASNLVFSWMDTRNLRGPDTSAYALLNDADQAPSPDVLEALRAYDVRPVLWSARADVLRELAA